MQVFFVGKRLNSLKPINLILKSLDETLESSEKGQNISYIEKYLKKILVADWEKKFVPVPPEQKLNIPISQPFIQGIFLNKIFLLRIFSYSSNIKKILFRSNMRKQPRIE